MSAKNTVKDYYTSLRNMKKHVHWDSSCGIISRILYFDFSVCIEFQYVFNSRGGRKRRLYPAWWLMAVHARDGFYAWFVCISAVLCNILIFGCTQGFGFILPALLDEFQEGKAKTAWVGSLALGLTMLFSPLAARLINRFGARPVGMAGGVIAALGLALSAIVTSIYALYVTFSVMYGLGACFSYTACYDIVPKYFKRKLGLAVGALSSGVGATVFIMSPINEILITNVGWRNSFYAFAGFLFLSGVCCLTFSPHVEQGHVPEHEQGNTIVFGQTLPLYKNGGVMMVCAYSFFFQVGNTIPLIHLGRYALESGLNNAQTANLYIGYGVASTVSRIVSGKICELRSFHASYICCSCAGIVAGVSNIVCPFIDGFVALIIYCCINGLADGVHVSSKSVLLMESCHTHQRTTAYGYLFFFTSLAYCSGPPLGGLIADQVGSYIPVFYASGSIVLVSGLLILTVRCFRRKHEETPRTEVKVLSGEFMMEEKATGTVITNLHAESQSGSLSIIQTDRRNDTTDRSTDGQIDRRTDGQIDRRQMIDDGPNRQDRTKRLIEHHRDSCTTKQIEIES